MAHKIMEEKNKKIKCEKCDCEMVIPISAILFGVKYYCPNPKCDFFAVFKDEDIKK